jgi:hypothetical protein
MMAGKGSKRYKCDTSNLGRSNHHMYGLQFALLQEKINELHGNFN